MLQCRLLMGAKAAPGLRVGLGRRTYGCRGTYGGVPTVGYLRLQPSLRYGWLQAGQAARTPRPRARARVSLFRRAPAARGLRLAADLGELQPHLPGAATLSTRGCNPVEQRLQPGLTEAATPCSRAAAAFAGGCNRM